MLCLWVSMRCCLRRYACSEAAHKVLEQILCFHLKMLHKRPVPSLSAFVIRKANYFGPYRYTNEARQRGGRHVNDYTDWCCLLWFYFASFTLLCCKPNLYLHFYPSDREARAKAETSRNAYTELTRLDRFPSNPDRMPDLLEQSPRVYTGVM